MVIGLAIVLVDKWFLRLCPLFTAADFIALQFADVAHRNGLLATARIGRPGSRKSSVILRDPRTHSAIRFGSRNSHSMGFKKRSSRVFRRRS
jgi:hypothetical protein